MKSYFFVPGNNIRFIEKTLSFESNNFIIDLEDGIYNKSIENSVNNILNLLPPLSFYIRISYDIYQNISQLNYLKKLLLQGYHRFIIPKINSVNDFNKIFYFLHDLSISREDLDFIILVENPSVLLELQDILQTDSIKGVGFGSHDYCSTIGMKHTYTNIYWARMEVLNIGKAMKKEVIDIASMNITNETEFIEECKTGFNMGFDAKFIIHPWQLKIFNSIHYYSDEEIKFAKSVKDYIDKIGGIDKFSIANIKGKVVEKAHLKEINRILTTIGYETIKSW